MQFDEYPEGEVQEKDFTVVGAIGSNERFTYEYDFGDSWEHDVTVHRVWRMPKDLKFAVCLDGANACPPEDVAVPGATSNSSRCSPTPHTRSTSTCVGGSVARSMQQLSTWHS